MHFCGITIFPWIYPNSPCHMSNKLSEIIRRFLDILVSSVMLLVSAPIMLLIAYKIKKVSPGPAIFRQTRVGKDGSLFTFYKFRSMWPDARKRFPELYAYKYTQDEIKRLKFKKREDPRIIPELHWLRKSSLDELPNFLNVLKGDMTLVGPRPDIPEMVKYYTERQMKKLSVKPGITGYAQINGRGDLGFQETLEEDLRYIEERSLLTDLWVILRTVAACFEREGAY